MEHEVRNSDLFNEIADILDFKPELYDQETWGEGGDTMLTGAQVEPIHYGNNNEFFVAKSDVTVKVQECDTTACIAGWASLLSGWHPVVNIYANAGTPGTYHCNMEYSYMANKPNIASNFRRMAGVEWNEEERHWADSFGTIVAEAAVIGQKVLGLNYDEANHLFDGKMEVEPDDLRMIGKPETNIFEYGYCGDCGGFMPECNCNCRGTE